jgi:3-deoxy-7-phosphoheptulonate synthase
MMIVMSPQATSQQIENVVRRVTEAGFMPHRSDGKENTVIGCVGHVNIDSVDPREFELLEGVSQVVRISVPYKLSSRTFKPEDTVVDAGNGVKVGGREVVLMAGPCTIESREQVEAIAPMVRQAGARIMRGGAFKPRTSPYAFQGMGEAGLRIIHEVASRHGLLVVSEVMDRSQIAMMMEYVDILQVGARNMQNFDLLRDLGKVRKPVLLKRGLAATIEELLLAAEYILAGGNTQVILCERGIRTFERATRNTLDISAIPVIKSLSHLPIIVDPSHATGIRDKVPPVARAAVAAGADGLLIEVHNQPEKALCDGAQSLLPEQMISLSRELKVIAEVIGRQFNALPAA